MCGIAGFWLRQANSERAAETLRSMTDCLAHRGPDDSDIWWNEGAGVGLGHRRLAIVDLSAEGHQPMSSASGRYTIVFNGEVYNFLRLRDELAQHGHRFRGHSDTEVMLAAMEQWGIDSAIERFIGMFAGAVWDGQLRRLTLFRDRFGKKPLYFSNRAGSIHFASELKALRRIPGLCSDIDRDALAMFLRFNHVPAPRSIYAGVSKLAPATIVHFARSATGSIEVAQTCYWSAAQVYGRAAANRFAGSFDDALAGLDVLLRDAVAIRMVSDVPLGAFLSGGIDSSTVVALMQAQSSSRVRTFSIGFSEEQYNEAAHAKQVAQHLGTEHTDLYVDAAQARAVIPLLPAMFDEPFADSSQIPTFLLCKLARQHVTVALSGDGGDEMFCGYNRYFWWRTLTQFTGFWPTPVRKALGHAAASVPVKVVDRAASVLRPLLPARLRVSAPGDKLHKIARFLRADSPEALYLAMLTHWNESDVIVPGATSQGNPRSLFQGYPANIDFTERMALHDALNYLPDDILVKVDRASMAVSLEARCPILDHRIAEFAATLPLDFKIGEGGGKRILRQLAYRYVPRELLERPKTGFAVPIDSWLRGPLREWAEALLDPARLKSENFLEPEFIRQRWTEHVSGGRQWQHLLWNVLMFQAWLDDARGVPSVAPRAA